MGAKSQGRTAEKGIWYTCSACPPGFLPSVLSVLPWDGRGSDVSRNVLSDTANCSYYLNCFTDSQKVFS